MARLLLFAVFLISCSFALADDGFINPPEESTENSLPSNYQVYKVGDILEVSWSTEAAVVDLIINQRDSPATQIDRPPNSEALTRNSYSWKITTDGSDGGSKFDLALNNNFNFILFQRNATSPIATSAYFNITNATVDQYGSIISASTSSTLLPTSTTSPTTLSTTTSASVIDSPPSSTSTVLAPESSSTGLSTSTKIGLGAGLGVAGVALIASLGIWYMIRLKRKKPQAAVAPVPPNSFVRDKFAQDNWSPPSELGAHAHVPPRPAPSELP
ncbi:hypothetical protein PVAG01_10775 [Phlyctema vagabunda]|uniref:Mid2 domain-containing protein n=1 Tax=Phlyctema vagabunda TaxID=108571 RepID=A0ABR4P387_9HELO